MRLLCGVVAVLLAALPAFASGHGPVFGMATPTNSKGEWSFDFTTAVRDSADGADASLRSMVTYGVTPHFQVTLSAPINLLDAAQPPARMMTGDAEAGIGWRFHRSAPRVGTRFETTLFANLVLPDLQRSPGLMSSLRRAPGSHIGVVTGLASRRHYLWAGSGYTGYTERGGDRRPHIFNYSLVWGYRPPPLEKDYPHWDWRLFLEGTGEAWSRVRHADAPMPGSSGHQLFVGPTTLGIYKNFAVSGGVQFPVYRDVGSAFPRERLRFAVIVSYFLFRFPGGHQ